eukprot:15038737-Alexandrium_andersonii.AAC.1
MSASLVGSEMCIRDRCNSPPAMTPPSTRRHHWAQAPAAAPARPATASSCLLYTSDAADDM